MPSAGPAPHYAPGGDWWWDGDAWHPIAPGALPPSRPAPAAPVRREGSGRSRRALLAAVAVVLIALLAAAAVGGAELVQRLADTDGWAARPGGAAAFVARLQAQGFACDHALRAPVDVWKCYRNVQGVHAELGAQLVAGGSVGVIRAIVGAAGVSNHPRALGPTEDALFELSVRALQRGVDAGRLRAWLRGAYPRRDESYTTLSGARLWLDSGLAGRLLQVAVGGARPRDIVGPALDHVDLAALDAMFATWGLSCNRTQLGTTCEGGTGRHDTSVNYDLDEAGRLTLIGLSVADYASDPYADVTGDAATRASKVLGAVLPEPDRARASAWARAAVQDGRHDTDIAGVYLDAQPIGGIDQPRKGSRSVTIMASFWLKSV